MCKNLKTIKLVKIFWKFYTYLICSTFYGVIDLGDLKNDVFFINYVIQGKKLQNQLVPIFSPKMTQFIFIYQQEIVD